MYKISEIPAYTSIGNQGESGVKTLTFDITEWQADYPDIVCAITMIAPSGGSPYLLTGVSQAGNILTWVVGHDATENDGTATIVIRGLIGDAEKRSAVAPVIIAHGHPAAGEAPAAVQDWIDEATALKSEIEAAETARASFREWTTDLEIAKGNKVSHQGSSYIWTLDAPGDGIEPPGGGWLLFAQRGSTLTAIFEIDWETGELVVIYPDDYTGLVFSINEDGELEVTIS